MPIPASVIIGADGVPDFSGIQKEKVRALVAKDACMLCGERMHGNEYAFIGGEKSIASRMFWDGPMHKECARYSFEACPFVSGAHRQYREPKHHSDLVMEYKANTTTKRMGMIVVGEYRYDPRTGLFSTGEPTRTLWEEELRASNPA